MKICVLLCLLASAFAADLSEKEFEEEFHELFSDKDDEAKAAETLAAAEKEIAEENAKFAAGESTYSEKLNALSDIPRDQFEQEWEGLTASPYSTGLIETPESEWDKDPEGQAELDELYDRMDRAYLPTNYDARNQRVITVPKNQMSCGSCAAFAATSVHETCLIKAGANLNGMDLSEQQLVDCGYNKGSMNGCNGAWVGSYQDWLAKHGGTVSHEAQYQYLDRDPNLRCMNKPKWSCGAKVTQAIADYRCDETKLKKLVYQYGAVATGIYASDSHFSNTDTGVFQGCSTTKINHAVTVVGYGTQRGVDYWLVKNSWGPHWGDKGYIKIRRGKGECGIGGNCVVAKCARWGSAKPAPKLPPPAPIPPNQVCDISDLYNNSNMNGSFKLTTKVNGKEYISNVKCKKSKCSPSIAGPSNACMYICGKVKC